MGTEQRHRAEPGWGDKARCWRGSAGSREPSVLPTLCPTEPLRKHTGPPGRHDVRSQHPTSPPGPGHLRGLHLLTDVWMYNLSYQSPPESCPSPCERQRRQTSRGPCSSPRWDTDKSDGLGFRGRRSGRVTLEPGAQPPRQLLRACPARSETRGRSSPAILAVRGATRTAGWGTGLTRLLPSAPLGLFN